MKAYPMYLVREVRGPSQLSPAVLVLVRRLPGGTFSQLLFDFVVSFSSLDNPAIDDHVYFTLR